MYPLQIEAGALFPAVITISALVIVFIIVILYALRRTRAMSDELTKEAKTKFDAIKPTAAPASVRNEENLARRLRPSSSIEPSGVSGSPNLLAELQDTKTRLRQFSQDYGALKEREATMRNELSTLRTEVRLLRDELLEEVGGIQKMKAYVEEQGGRFQDVKKSIEKQLQEIKKQAERLERAATETTAQQPANQTVPEPPAAQSTPQTSQPGFLRGFFRHVTCSNCGRRLRSQDRFCDSCGRAPPTG